MNEPRIKDGPAPQTLADQIVHILTLDLLLRRIEPGTWLREADLAARFNVSRQAIREAMQRLELLGHLEIVPRRGARAVDYVPEELDDLITFHAVVFGCSCRLAAERRTPEQLADIRDAVDHLARIAASDAGAEEYEIVRLQCYTLVQRATGVAHELNERRSFVTRMRHPYSIDAVATPQMRVGSAARWRTLVDLIAARDGAGAERQFMHMADATRPAILAACRAARVRATQTDLATAPAET